LLAKIVNGVKQPTVFCPFERLVRRYFVTSVFRHFPVEHSIRQETPTKFFTAIYSEPFNLIRIKFVYASLDWFVGFSATQTTSPN